MNILVSGVSGKEGERKAYVRFEDGEKFAEGTIPACTIISSEGLPKEKLRKWNCI